MSNEFDVTVTMPRVVAEYFLWWLARGKAPPEGLSSEDDRRIGLMRGALDAALEPNSLAPALAEFREGVREDSAELKRGVGEDIEAFKEPR